MESADFLPATRRLDAGRGAWQFEIPANRGRWRVDGTAQSREKPMSAESMPEHRLLTLNAGSSSLKFAFFERSEGPRRVLSGYVGGIGRPAGTFRVRDGDGNDRENSPPTPPIIPRHSRLPGAGSSGTTSSPGSLQSATSSCTADPCSLSRSASHRSCSGNCSG